MESTTSYKIAGATFLATVTIQMVTVQPHPPLYPRLAKPTPAPASPPDLRDCAEEIGNVLSVTSSGDSALLKEDGDRLLTEEGGRVLLEESQPVPMHVILHQPPS